MGLKERIIGNVVRHLQTTGTFMVVAIIMKAYVLPWMISSGALSSTFIAG